MPRPLSNLHILNQIVLLSNQALRLINLKWNKSILYYKMDKKSIVKDLYQASLISVFAIGYSMLGKKILHMAPPSIQKFDLKDTGKLVAIVAVSEMMREYLIKQKILPDHINIEENGECCDVDWRCINECSCFHW